jgi:hypothetical protein
MRRATNYAVLVQAPSRASALHKNYHISLCARRMTGIDITVSAGAATGDLAKGRKPVFEPGHSPVSHGFPGYSHNHK